MVINYFNGKDRNSRFDQKRQREKEKLLIDLKLYLQFPSAVFKFDDKCIASNLYINGE